MKDAVISFLLQSYRGTPAQVLEQMRSELEGMTLDQIAQNFLEVLRLQGC